MSQMRKIRVLPLIFFLIFLSTQFFSQTENANSGDQDELEIILKKCAEYCAILNNSVLNFVCEEKITEDIFIGVPFLMEEGRNIYIYDYQLIRKEKKIVEQRILIDENGEKRNTLNAQLKTKRFQHKYIVFGPVGLLRQEQQKNYGYKILEDVMYKEEAALILEALPKSPSGINALYGKIWIRKKDYAILKIEWYQESLEDFEGIEKIAEVLDAKPKFTFISEFGFEKNKIRFPNKFSVEELYIPRSGGEGFILSKTAVIYDNYKFFTVETGVKY